MCGLRSKEDGIQTMKILLDNITKDSIGDATNSVTFYVNNALSFSPQVLDTFTFFESDIRWLEFYGFDPLDVPTNYRGLSR